MQTRSQDDHSANRIIEDAGDSLDPDLLRAKMDTIGCGSIVSIHRFSLVGWKKAFEVIHLEFDAWIEQLPKVLPLAS